jgi:diguanylate cyclase (GGDEF)-like protein
MVATRVDTDSILKFAASEILALSGADRSILYLGHARNPVLIPAADAGTAPGEQERVRELRLDLTSAALAPLAEDRVPLLFHGDAKAPPGEIVVFADTRALLLIPLVSRDVIMGAIALAWVGRHHTTDPVHMEFLHDVAQQVALSLENARLFAAMSRMAATDELTRLANRRRFMEAFQLELARARRNGAPVSVIMLDVDHLKKVNDTFGHPAGDAAIRHVADVLRSGRRETDVPARLGGEEFALLLPATDLEGAVKAAEIVHRELNGSNVPNVGTVTASIGVATFPEDGVEAKDLLKTADERLYSAKAAGRNQVCYLSLPTTIPPAGANAAPKPEA